MSENHAHLAESSLASLSLDLARSTRSSMLKVVATVAETRSDGRSENQKCGAIRRRCIPPNTSLRTVHRVRVPVSMKLNLIPASPRPPSSEPEVGGTRGTEGRLALVRHPRKGGAPRGARLTRHPAGSSHSYCQLPTLRPSRSSLALDFG